MASKLLCPFCFEPFKDTDAHWRCDNESCRNPVDDLPGEPDEQYRDYLQEMNPDQNIELERRGHTFELPVSPNPLFRFRQQGKTAFCDWCGKRSATRVCPKCHNSLPYSIDDIDNYVIAIIGGPNVGKSHFIATLIDQLKNSVGLSFDMSLMSLGDDTTKRYKRDFYDPLYLEHRTLDKSQVVDRAPLMYRLKRVTSKGPKSVMLVFFDNAGETFGSDHQLGVFARYVRYANAVILLADPLQMPAIRNQLGSQGVALPPSDLEPAEILSRVIRQFEQFGAVKPGHQIPVPICVAFTKADLLRDHEVLPPGNAVFGAPRQVGRFDTEAARQVHDEVQAMLASWNGMEMDALLRHHFTTFSYSAISAIGSAPQAGRVPTVQPFRVEDPFLWSLSAVKFL